ncbi:MAG: PKD domain-containing protein [Bacteroidia bacterium]
MKKYSYLLFFNFFFAFIAIAQPTLTSPSDGASGLIAPVTFKWIADPNANNYDFQIATNPSFTSNLSTVTVWDPQYIRSSGLSAGVTYYWRMRSNYGSSYSAYTFSRSFTMQSVPVASFSGSPTSICAGSDVSFYSSSSGVTSYSWSFPGGTPSSSTSSSPTVTYNSAGVYSVTLTVSNSLGNNTLTKTNYINVGTNFSASVSVTQGSLLKCPVDTVELTASHSGTGYTYLWSNSATSQSIKTTQFGTFSVAISKGGCTKNISRVIVRDTLPIFISTPNGTSICLGDSVQLIAFDSGYTGFVWSTNATGTQIVAKQPSLYTVTATDNKSCPRKGSVTVTNPYGTKKITVSGYANPLCSSDSITLTGPSGFNSYSWSNGKTTLQIIIGNPGAYVLTFADSIGCKGKDSVNLQFVKENCYKGIYTIGGVNPDFISPRAAIDSLNKYKVVGKVVLKIREGTYNSRLRLRFIKGSSLINNIVFESENGIASNVIITADDSLMYLDSVWYITFKNLTFKEANHERLVYSNTTSDRYKLVSIHFIGNIFIGIGNENYYYQNRTNYTDGFSRAPMSFNYLTNSSLVGNRFERMYCGFYALGGQDILISGNTFLLTADGITFRTNSKVKNITIEKNIILLNDNLGLSNLFSTALGFAPPGAYATPTGLNIISNSIVISGSTASKFGRVRGIEVYHFQKCNIFNNNITNNYIRPSTATPDTKYDAAVDISGYTDGNLIHNNIIGNPALYYNCDSFSIINNNLSAAQGKNLVLHVVNSTIKLYRNNNYSVIDSTLSTFRGGVGGNSYKTYSAWKNVQNYDKDSRFINPKYVSFFDLTPTNPLLNNTADTVTAVPLDINGSPRTNPKTDIGSYEINSFKDVKIDSVLLSGYGCNTTVTPKVRLRNNSLFYKVYKNDSVNIYYSINGGSPQTLVHGFKKDSLNFNDTALVNLPGLTLNQGSLNTIRFWINYTSDSAQWNDSISHVYYVYKIPSVDFTSTGFCAGTAISFTSQTSPVVFYKWSFPDGSFVNAANASKVFTEGNHNITLQVTSAQGCSNTITKPITVLSQPSIAVTRTGDSLSAVAGMSYKWYLNNTLLPNDTLQKVKIKQSGNYKVTVTSPQGCSNSSTNMFYAVTGIKGFDNTDQVMVYPVPATNLLFIELLRANTGSYILTDVTGKEIVQGTLKQGLNSVGLETVKTGIYFITVQTAAGDQLIRKIIKE